MKQSYEVYKIGSKVYAVSDYLADSKSTNHFAIYPAIIKDANISKKKGSSDEIEIDYWLETPSGEDWGTEVNEKFVSDSFEELTKVLKEIWDNDKEYQ